MQDNATQVGLRDLQEFRSLRNLQKRNFKDMELILLKILIR
jgi:hypothetical protein